MFLPIDPPAAPEQKDLPDAGEATVAPVVEIVLRNGRELRCRGGIGDEDLARLIRLVETA